MLAEYAREDQLSSDMDQIVGYLSLEAWIDVT